MSSIKNDILKFIKKNDTSLLTGVGIAGGLLLGSWLWYKTGAKVEKAIKSKEIELNRKLTKKEKVKLTWKLFILPTINTVVSGGFLIGSVRLGNKKLAALGAAYNLTEATLQKYIEKTREELTSNTVDKINQSVAEDNVKTNGNNIIFAGDNGDVKFYDPLSGRYFKSTWTKIQKAANELNAYAMGSMEGKISVTEWYDRLGILKPETDNYDERVWDIQRDGKNGMIDISIDAALDENDIPCGSIRYNTRPKYM